MKTCGYCGLENLDDATACGGCGQTRWVEPQRPPPLPGSFEEKVAATPADELSEAGIEATASEETALCPSCLWINAPDAQSCVQCGAPVGLVVTLGQWEPLLGQHYAMDRGTERRSRTFLLLVVWLMLGVGILIVSLFAIGLMGGFLEGYYGWGPGAAISLLACAGLIAFKVWLLYHATRRYKGLPEETAPPDEDSPSAMGGRIAREQNLPPVV